MNYFSTCEYDLKKNLALRLMHPDPFSINLPILLASLFYMSVAVK